VDAESPCKSLARTTLPFRNATLEEGANVPRALGERARQLHWWGHHRLDQWACGSLATPALEHEDKGSDHNGPAQHSRKNDKIGTQTCHRMTHE
jgi:hypothetical protein